MVNRKRVMDATLDMPAVLVVLAHPDDESFPMGGTLAKYAAQGAQVTLVCATRGEAGIPDLTAEETAQIRTPGAAGCGRWRWGWPACAFWAIDDGQLAEADPTRPWSNWWTSCTPSSLRP